MTLLQSASAALALAAEAAVVYLVWCMAFRADEKRGMLTPLADRIAYGGDHIQPLFLCIFLGMVHGLTVMDPVIVVGSAMWLVIPWTIARRDEHTRTDIFGLMALCMGLLASLLFLMVLVPAGWQWISACIIAVVLVVSAVVTCPRPGGQDRVVDGLTPRSRTWLLGLALLMTAAWVSYGYAAKDPVVQVTTVVAALLCLYYVMNMFLENAERRWTNAIRLADYEAARYRLTGMLQLVEQETVDYLDEMIQPKEMQYIGNALPPIEERNHEITRGTESVVHFMVQWLIRAWPSFPLPRDYAEDWFTWQGPGPAEGGALRGTGHGISAAAQDMRDHIGTPDTWVLADHLASMSRHPWEIWRELAYRVTLMSSPDWIRFLGISPYGDWTRIGQAPVDTDLGAVHRDPFIAGRVAVRPETDFPGFPGEALRHAIERGYMVIDGPDGFERVRDVRGTDSRAAVPGPPRTEIPDYDADLIHDVLASVPHVDSLPRPEVLR